jgi:peptide/nickel transport system substrate-binding protein
MFGFYSFADAKEFDGIWFLGFNVQQPPFDSVKVRQAVAHCLDRAYISKIAGEEKIPASFIPPGIEGYNADLKPYGHNVKFAKTLMKRAGYAASDPYLKSLSLLHTDGIKTIEIAKKIQKDLKQLGMGIELVQVSYWDEEKWDSELRSGKHRLFLMGYKAEVEKLFTEEAGMRETNSALLLEPLFRTGGAANFTGYSNSSVDMLLDQISVIDPSMKKERALKLREVNKLIYKDQPAVLLFYIEKL